MSGDEKQSCVVWDNVSIYFVPSISMYVPYFHSDNESNRNDGGHKLLYYVVQALRYFRFRNIGTTIAYECESLRTNDLRTISAQLETP